MPPATRYARSGDIHIAYQVVADGPFDLLFVPGFISHLEANWDDPNIAAMFEKRGVHTLKGVPGEWRLFAVERG